jgi:hypothetical protein
MRHHLIGRSLFALLAVFTLVSANVEKAICLGPPTVNIPALGPSLAALSLDSLSPENTTVRRELARRFPSGSDTPVGGSIKGETSWFILDNLNGGQRYEVRICWSALVRRIDITLRTISLD